MTGVFSCGVPSLVTEVSSGIVMIVFNRIILGLAGNTGVAAYGVIANLSLVVIAVYTGIAQGMQPLLSHNYGAGDGKAVRSILRYGMVTMFVLSVVLYGIVFLKADPIASVFNSEGNVHLQAIAADGMKYYFTAIAFAGMNILFSAYYTSTDHGRPAYIISFLRGFALILPLTFLFARLFGMTGVWCAFPVTEGLVALIGSVLFFGWDVKKRT